MSPANAVESHTFKGVRLGPEVSDSVGWSGWLFSLGLETGAGAFPKVWKSCRHPLCSAPFARV